MGLTAPQVGLCQSLLNQRVTNVRAGHGVGKTHCAALLILWWVFARHALAITTAPTQRQVKELLWGEIRKAYDHHRLSLGGHRLELALHLNEGARAYGFTAKSNSSDGFQGIHSSAGVLVIIDEANGVSGEIDDGATACTTGLGDRLLRIGNPTARGTPFERHCAQSSLAIPVWCHPNLKDKYQLGEDGIHRLKPDGPGPPYSYAVPGAVSVEWVESVRRDKGENSPYWQGRVEAQFPETNAASLVPLTLWDNTPPAPGPQGPVRLRVRWAVDVGGGNDDHAIAGWVEKTLVFLKSYPSGTVNTSEIARIALGLAQPGDVITVDKVGVGLGTLDTLRELAPTPRVTVLGISNGAKSPSKEYRNWIAWAAWTFRLALGRGEVTVAPDVWDSREFEQAKQEFEQTYYETIGDKMIGLEDKELTKARLGRSPDRRDAILMAWPNQGQTRSPRVRPRVNPKIPP